MIDTRIEVNVVADHFIQRRALGVLGKTSIAPPVIRNGTAAMRDDEPERWEIFEEIGCDELHERRRIRVDVIGAGCMETGIACGADMNHRRHIEIDHFFVERIPIFVGQRRRVETATRWIRIQIAPNEPQLPNTSFKFGNRIQNRHAR